MFNLSSANAPERLFGKITIGLLVASALAVVGFPLAGVLIGEDVRGNFAYGLYIGAFMVVGALAACAGSNSEVRHAARWGWAILSVATFAFSIYLMQLNDPEGYKAADTVLLVVMGILSFPASVLGFGIVFAYSALLAGNGPTTMTDLTMFWVIMSALGALQWFVLAPSVKRWWIRRHRLAS